MAAAAAALAMGLDARRRRRMACGPSRACPTGSSGSAEIGGVTYVNDSKATNVAAARAAISSFDGAVHVILGGSSKGERFGELAEPLAEHAAAAT